MVSNIRNFQDVIDSKLDFLMTDVNGFEIKDQREYSWSLIEILSEINENEKKFVFVPFMKLK